MIRGRKEQTKVVMEACHSIFRRPALRGPHSCRLDGLFASDSRTFLVILEIPLGSYGLVHTGSMRSKPVTGKTEKGR